MANDNSITVIGNATRDPEIRFTESGTPVANFGIAVNQRVQDEHGNWKDGATSFFNCVAWRDLAENIADSVTKGNRLTVTGQMRQRTFEVTPEGATEPEKRVVWELQADDVAISLRWATVNEVVKNASPARTPAPTDADDPKAKANGKAAPAKDTADV